MPYRSKAHGPRSELALQKRVGELPVWTEAILTKDDLEKVVSDFCPLTINLSGGGSILLSNPRDFALLPDVGLRVTVAAEVEWPLLGIHIPVSIRSATLEIKPEIQTVAALERLTFRLGLEDVDLSMLPAFVERGIVERINKELDAKHVELSWSFTETLSHVFELPSAIASGRAIELSAKWGRVKITSEALAFAVSFQTEVHPRTSEPEASSPILSSATEPADAPNSPMKHNSLPGSSRPSDGMPAADGTSPAPPERGRNQRPRRGQHLAASIAWAGVVGLLACLGISAIAKGRRHRKLLGVWRELP
jgi:hypothetical protein